MSLIKQLLQLTRDNVIPESVAIDLLRTVRQENITHDVNAAPTERMPDNEPLAVIGMAARLPGAETLEEFWHHLIHGHTAVTDIPPMRWPKEALSGPQKGAFLQGAFDFDPELFGLREQQASYLDPQQRLMLTVAHETLENALITPTQRQQPTSVGVFIGSRMKSYGFDHYRDLPEGAAPMVKQELEATALWGRSQNFIATWISDRFNFSGPSLLVDTACSSSLTALWLACQSVRSGECHLAMAGGVDLLLDPLTVKLLHKAGALSPDGKCWTFDERANGYVPGEGAAAVMLKRLSAAERDGDHIWGIIRSVGVNNDGYTMGVTTPNLEAQIELLRRLHRTVGFEGLGLVEAHGTGTAIGDPIEVKALSEVLGHHYPTNSVALGSVKTNIGHLHSAAGITSVVKALLCLYHKQIPASLNSTRINPRLGLASSPFHVPQVAQAWPRQGAPRRAAVSSFGFGGTNGHVIVEEAAVLAKPTPPDSTQEMPDLLVLSERAGWMLRRRAVDVLNLLQESPAALSDICTTSRLGSAHYQERLALIGQSKQAMIDQLQAWIQQEPERHNAQLVQVPADVAHQLQAWDVPSHTVHIDATSMLTPLEAIAQLYMAGLTINWSAIQGERSWHKVVLPPTQQHRRTFHLEEPQRSPMPGVRQNDRPHPMIDKVQTMEGHTTFHRHFNADDVFLQQHAVYHQFMLPGVAWLALLDGVLVCMGKRSTATMERIVFHQPLIYRQGGVTARGEIEASGQFKIRDAERGDLFVTGQLQFGEPATFTETVPVNALLSASKKFISGTALYRCLRRMGYYHGDYYRNIAWTSKSGDQRVLARIEGGRQAEWNEPNVALFPGLLDSITIAALEPNNPALHVGRGVDAFVPISIERVEHVAALDTAVYVDTVIHKWTDEVCRCTQTVCDRHGNILLRFHNIASKRVPPHGFGADASVSVPPAATTPPVNTSPPIPTTQQAATPANTLQALDERLLHWLLALMGRSTDIADTEFLSAGLDSMQLVQLSEQIAARAHVDLYPTVFFEYPTPRELVAYFVEAHHEAFKNLLATEQPVDSIQPRPAPLPSPEPQPAAPAISDNTPEVHENALAIIGMGMRFPGADSAEKFWQILTAGESRVTPPPPDRRAAFSDPNIKGGFLERVDQFDSSVFGISPREAPYIDPQARIFYEVAWEALENAGYAGRSQGTNTGIWVGYSHDHYYEERLRTGTVRERGLGLQTAIPNRLSYWLDWHGPSMVVNTLCSSSLVALHQAGQSLLAGECDMALVGGVHLALSDNYYRSMNIMNALSPTGLCRTFDKSADGYVPGEGAGAILVKRYADALRDGDNIQALVLGSAINHSGRASRLSAPNPQAQRSVLAQAWANAGISPDTLGYIEAHGTGTKLGDPIELTALKQAFGEKMTRYGFCGIGSVKSLFGHLESAAGIASLLKVILCMQHNYLPPTLHVVEPNPSFDFAESPFFIVDEGQAWQGTPKRVAVSSFGMLGVNAHVVLEEAPKIIPKRLDASAHIIKLTATQPEAMRQLALRYEQRINQVSDATELAHVCHTLNVGRANFRYRTAVVGSDAATLAAKLREVAQGHVEAHRLSANVGRTAFLFTGQGAQYANMGRKLYDSEPTFRHTLDECAALFDAYLDVPLLNLLYGQHSDQINQTCYAQPTLFAIEYALFNLLASWGVKPDVVLGHSLGEYVAACVAGVFSLEDAVRLVALRGQLMQAQRPDGAMAVIRASHTMVEQHLHRLASHPVEIAAINSPLSTVITGSAPNVAHVCQSLSLPTVPLRVSHAFHSQAMTPAIQPLAEAIGQVRRHAPTIPIIANVNGQFHSDESACDPHMWGYHLRQPVLFADCIQTAWSAGVRIFWELGPRAMLLTLGKQTIQADALWLPSLHGGTHDDYVTLLDSAARYYSAGCGELNWSALSSQGHIVPAPTYPFAHERYWLEEASTSTSPSIFIERAEHSVHDIGGSL